MPELALGARRTERQEPAATVRPPRPALRDREPLVRLEPALGAAHDAEGVGMAPVRGIRWILHGLTPDHIPPLDAGVGKANRCPSAACARDEWAPSTGQRYSGFAKSKRQPASHSERWLPCAGTPPAFFRSLARWSRFHVMNVVLRLVKSFSGPPDPGSR